MKYRLIVFVPIIMVLFLSACGPVTVIVPTGIASLTVQAPTASGSLPDLVVSNVYLGMQGVDTGSGNCVSAYASFEIRVTIRNLGPVPASTISVVELSTGTTLPIAELGAGQAMELHFPATSPNGSYNVAVDPQNSIPETNENNNIFSYLAPTPTPPALCTPTLPPVVSTAYPDFTPVSSDEPLPQTDAMIIWQSAGTFCQTASFWADHMTYGSCPPDLPPSQWPLSTLAYAQLPEYAKAYTSRYPIWMKAYAPFIAQTPAGTVTFNGSGYVIATPAEQRMMAEWAIYMFSEIPESSTSGGGMPISAHFSSESTCFDVAVYRDGRYRVESCLSGFTYPAPNGYLDANELLYFYRWADSLDSYQTVSELETLSFINIFRTDGLVAPTIADKLSIETLVFNLESRAKGQNPTSGGGIPAAVSVAQKALAQQLGIPLDQTQIKAIEPVDFPDSCLGVAKPGEVCVQGITSGLRVQLLAQGMLYEFHTDVAGYDLRQYGNPQPAPQGAGG